MSGMPARMKFEDQIMSSTMCAAPADVSRLTILVLASTYPRWAGDPEPGFIHELCKRLSLEHRIIVLCPHATGASATEMLDGVEVVRYRYAPEKWEVLVNNGGIVNNLRRKPLMAMLLPSFFLFQLFVAARLARLHRIDAIHAHWLIPQGLIAALVCRLFAKKIPFIVTSHGADLYALRGRLMSLLKRFVAKRANAITVVSGAMQSDMARLEVEVNKITVQPMGIDFESRFTPHPATERSLDEILFVGRLVEKKGLNYLLDAMPAICAARPSVRLKIAGFGPEEASLREQAGRMGLNQVVHFIGPVRQADLPALYRQAAVLVAPFVRASNGDVEGLGLVVGEAIGCHCPVIVGDVPAVKDVITDGEGKVISPLDAAALANAVVAVMENPKSALDSVTKARIRLNRQLSWPVVAAGYSKLLRKICGSNGSQLVV
jgi:glycosyltransferase involved in cell wall biosynthesis